MNCKKRPKALDGDGEVAGKLETMVSEEKRAKTHVNETIYNKRPYARTCWIDVRSTKHPAKPLASPNHFLPGAGPIQNEKPLGTAPQRKRHL